MAHAIISAPNVTKNQVLNYLHSTPLGRPNDVDIYVSEIWRLGLKTEYNPAYLIAQACVETGNPSVADNPFWSPDWVNDLNPAGIGHTDSGKQHYLSTNNALVSARVQWVHMAGYVEGENGKWTGSTVYKALDPRWIDLKNSGMMGSVTNVEDLGNGKWSTQPGTTYADNILAYVGKFAAQPDTVPGTLPDSALDRSKISVLISAGHRSIGDYQTADHNEADRTPALAHSYVAELKKRGYKVAYLQNDVDGDGKDDWTDPGTLDTVAQLMNGYIAKQTEVLTICAEMHYNGPHSPCHVIVPDDVGLVAVSAGGSSPASDTAQNNIWDCKLAGMIAAEYQKQTGMALYDSWRLGIPGVMSERDTGVAIEFNARLAVFGSTAQQQEKSIRLVCEHGGYFDPPAEQDNFTELCAIAFANALDQFVKDESL